MLGTVSGISIHSSALVLISKNRRITLSLSFISIDGILSADLKGQVLDKLSGSKSNIYGTVIDTRRY